MEEEEEEEVYCGLFQKRLSSLRGVLRLCEKAKHVDKGEGGK